MNHSVTHAPTTRHRWDYRDTADLFADAIGELGIVGDLNGQALLERPHDPLTQRLLQRLDGTHEPGIIHASDLIFDPAQTRLRHALAAAGIPTLPLVPGPGWTAPASTITLSLVQAAAIREARPFAFEAPDQLLALAGASLPPDFAVKLLSLPFPATFIDCGVDAPVAIRFPNADGPLLSVYPRAILLCEQRLRLKTWCIPDLHRTLRDERCHLHIATVFTNPASIPEALRLPGSGRVAYAGHMFWPWAESLTYTEALTASHALASEDQPFWDLVAKILLFIQSPTIVQERASTTPYLRRTTAEVGRAADPAPYILRIRHPRVVARGPHLPGTPSRAYRYRFDVRGHWKHFTKGQLTGRVIWCPAFVKGPVDTPYRPRFNVLLQDEGNRV